jgi:hypothetical protein
MGGATDLQEEKESVCNEFVSLVKIN